MRLDQLQKVFMQTFDQLHRAFISTRKKNMGKTNMEKKKKE
jgi:hypothetical protein